MRHTRLRIAGLAATMLLAACGSTEYRDTNAAVDANPLCVSRPNQPGEPVSRGCDLNAGGAWRTRRESRPVVFGTRGDD